MKLLSLFTEEIHAREAHSESGSLRTILNGRRDIAFVDINKSMIDDIEKRKLGILPVRMTSLNSMKAILYRDVAKKDALRLFVIAKSKHDYLKDETPEEAYEIGKLLGYSEDSIKEYIWKKYHSKSEPSDNPDDYSDFH